MPNPITIDTLPLSELMALFEKMLFDPRKACGKRYSLVSVVSTMALATLCGVPCVYHIAEWARNLSWEVRKKLGMKGNRVPGHVTLHRISKMVDVQQFIDAARAFQNKHCGPLAGKGVAIDGKTIRGAKGTGEKAPHVVSAIRHDNKLPIAQITVPEKTNEIGVLPELLEQPNLAGAMVTLDAMHTNEKTAAFITEFKEADYLLTIKDNQPKLLADVKHLFAEGAFSPSVQGKSDKSSR
jgi:hypothetical protein